MNKCPKCENENLKEEYNYCPVCGRVINQTAKEAAIEMLKTMRDFHIEQECDDLEDEKFKLSCVGALEIAIRELERPAPEVPVQEQPIKIALGGHETDKTLHAHGEVLKEQEQYEFESFHKSYPTEITIIAPISPYKEIGIEPLNKDCNEAVRINLQIDSPLYRKEEVLKSIKYAINKILANYI